MWCSSNFFQRYWMPPFWAIHYSVHSKCVNGVCYECTYNVLSRVYVQATFMTLLNNIIRTFRGPHISMSWIYLGRNFHQLTPQVCNTKIQNKLRILKQIAALLSPSCALMQSKSCYSCSIMKCWFMWKILRRKKLVCMLVIQTVRSKLCLLPRTCALWALTFSA